MTTNETTTLVEATTSDLSSLTKDQILDEGYLTASRLKELLK